MIHARWRDTYGPSFIRPTFRGVIREVISRFSLAETETKLAEIREEILANMEQRLSDEGLILENLTIDAITLSE
jgi:regulator of protease activity HflC (stomatin/prohibitin superfamily)